MSSGESNPLRIWHLVRNYYPKTGGNQNQCKILCEQLVKKKLDVVILTERFSLSLPKYERIGNLQIIRIKSLNSYKEKYSLFYRIFFFKHNYISHKLKTLWYILAEYSFLLNTYLTLIRHRNSYDLLHIHQSNWIAFWGLAATRLIKKECLIKDATLGGFEELEQKAFSKLIRKYLIKNGNFIAISALIKTYLLDQSISENRIFSVSNGTLIPKKSYLSNPDNFDVLFVGNYWQGKIKGLDILIEAMEEVIGINSSVNLLIVGEGPTSIYEDVIKKMHIGSNVRFLGKQKVSPYFESTSIFVLPSRSEGMSNALMEAMAFGMPCISTKVSGSIDLIEDGMNGLLVETENPKQLAHAILYLFSNRKKAVQMGINARKTIETKFTTDIVSAKYIQIYQSLINKNE